MAETLGSLCDKLSIVKLKQYHCDGEVKMKSLFLQAEQLSQEIDDFIRAAFSGNIPVERLVFNANKIYKQAGNETLPVPDASIGAAFSELVKVNCDLWHEQENVYEFEKVPINEKDVVVKQLALLNLRRNQCIDAIDKVLATLVRRKTFVSEPSASKLHGSDNGRQSK